MRAIISKLIQYWLELDKKVFVLILLFTSLLVFLNYYFGISRFIVTLPEIPEYLAWVCVFCLSFGVPYVLTFYNRKHSMPVNSSLILMILMAPLLFAWKMSYDVHLPITSDKTLNIYWNQVLYWPLKLVVISFCLLLIWKLFNSDTEFYGTRIKDLKWKPYILMLLIMIPLIAAASTQPDFLSLYPKLKNVSYLATHENSVWYKILYELAYGTDFISIELFFRGFLILAFARWVGKDAILPMACFYCTIHFGKPLGECISSFFGGLILGVISYHTRSILGGLVVHLGIAWMMELGGFLGNSYSM